jgi:hypothetical protein
MLFIVRNSKTSHEFNQYSKPNLGCINYVISFMANLNSHTQSSTVLQENDISTPQITLGARQMMLQTVVIYSELVYISTGAVLFIYMSN